MEPDLYVYDSIVNTRRWFYTEVAFTIQAQTFVNSRQSREPHGSPEGRSFSGTVPHVSTYKRDVGCGMGRAKEDDVLLDEYPTVIK
jgi:hypothetical protein